MMGLQALLYHLESVHDPVQPWKEVKKKGAERLHWDVYYKVWKHLSQFHGKPIFKGFVTTTNEYKEIHIQFNVVTDRQDQFTNVLGKFKETIAAYSQKEPYLFTTDNPVGDRNFFLNALPSLQKSDDKLNSNVLMSTEESDDMTNACDVDLDQVITVSSNGEISNKLISLRESLLDTN